MKLSIIVPVYNVERYVHACMDSIYRQGLDEKDFEVVIVNDGTEDRSMEIIQDIIDAHSNITIINQENLSLSMARNNGIAAAKGEYVLMPDSDDLLIDNSVPFLLEKALETKADMVVAEFLEMTDEEIEHANIQQPADVTMKEYLGTAAFLEALNPHQCYVWRALLKREFIVKNQLSFVPRIRYQDVPFTHECYLKANKCLKTSWLLNIYRKGHESATYSFNKKKAKELCISIANTWKLRAIDDMTAEVRKKLNNDIFASFALLIYLMLYGIKSRSERKEIFAFLNNEIPNLYFTNGWKQKFTSFLFRLSPEFYFMIRQALKWCTIKPNFG